MDIHKNIKILYALIISSFGLLFVCIISIIFLFRKNKTEQVKYNALNYSLESTANQGITTLDSVGNMSYLSFPTGIIVVWYPIDSTMTSLALVSRTVPLGWAICDGSKGTPDLRGRFVLMAQDTGNGTYGSTSHVIGGKGGEQSHLLSDAEMPQHQHTFTVHDSGQGGDQNFAQREYGSSGRGTVATDMRGGGQPHNNMPPFYTLVYIMRL